MANKAIKRQSTRHRPDRRSRAVRKHKPHEPHTLCVPRNVLSSAIHILVYVAWKSCFLYTFLATHWLFYFTMKIIFLFIVGCSWFTHRLCRVRVIHSQTQFNCNGICCNINPINIYYDRRVGFVCWVQFEVFALAEPSFTHRAQISDIWMLCSIDTASLHSG